MYNPVDYHLSSIGGKWGTVMERIWSGGAPPSRLIDFFGTFTLTPIVSHLFSFFPIQQPIYTYKMYMLCARLSVPISCGEIEEEKKKIYVITN